MLANNQPSHKWNDAGKSKDLIEAQAKLSSVMDRSQSGTNTDCGNVETRLTNIVPERKQMSCCPVSSHSVSFDTVINLRSEERDREQQQPADRATKGRHTSE